METATGKEVSSLPVLSSVTVVAFSPDGKWVAAGGDDKTARVMEAATGLELRRIKLPGVPLAIRFSGDGRELEVLHRVSSGYDVIYARYPLDPRDLIRESCKKVTRNLTVKEWRRYAGAATPYRRTCENRPLPADYK